MDLPEWIFDTVDYVLDKFLMLGTKTSRLARKTRDWLQRPSPVNSRIHSFAKVVCLIAAAIVPGYLALLGIRLARQSNRLSAKQFCQSSVGALALSLE